MALRGADATDSKNLDNALQELVKHKLNAQQFETLKGMWRAWDNRGDVTDEEEAALYQQFANNFALGGAITQIIHIAEKYDQNDMVDKQIKDKLGKALDQLEANMDKKSTSTYRK